MYVDDQFLQWTKLRHGNQNKRTMETPVIVVKQEDFIGDDNELHLNDERVILILFSQSECAHSDEALSELILLGKRKDVPFRIAVCDVTGFEGRLARSHLEITKVPHFTIFSRGKSIYNHRLPPVWENGKIHKKITRDDPPYCTLESAYGTATKK